MSATSYGTGLIGTTALAEMLGFLETAEAYGASNKPGVLYDDNPYGSTDASHAPTIGFGFNLQVSNTLAAVLDGILPNGVTYVSGAENQNVFVASAQNTPDGQTILSPAQITSYFEWLVGQYKPVSNPSYSIADLTQTLTNALQQFFSGNGDSLYNTGPGSFVQPGSGVNGSSVTFAFSPTNATNAEQVLSNLLVGATIYEGEAGNLTISGYSPNLYNTLTGQGVPLDGNENLIGAGPTSEQWVAAVAAAYNGLPRRLSAGLAFGDPAQTWYTLRYSTQAPYRGYLESQEFGINGSSTGDPTAALALQDYEVLNEHRSTILNFESVNGIDPDTGTGLGAAISNAVKFAERMGKSTNQFLQGPLAVAPSFLQSVTSPDQLSLEQTLRIGRINGP